MYKKPRYLDVLKEPRAKENLFAYLARKMKLAPPLMARIYINLQRKMELHKNKTWMEQAISNRSRAIDD